MNQLETIQRENLRTDLPDFSPGDTIKAHVIIKEGDKERVQVFTGTVLAIHGTGIARRVTMRRVAYGQGVERVFPLHSPSVDHFEVVRRGSVRRAKLYYLRDQIGKAARVREQKTV